MAEKLKACPFCGKHDGKVCRHPRPMGGETKWVRCQSCGAQGSLHGSARAARAAWNRRPNA